MEEDDLDILPSLSLTMNFSIVDLQPLQLELWSYHTIVLRLSTYIYTKGQCPETEVREAKKSILLFFY